MIHTSIIERGRNRVNLCLTVITKVCFMQLDRFKRSFCYADNDDMCALKIVHHKIAVIRSWFC